MTMVQIVVANPTYAAQLEKLLLSDGQLQVLRPPVPDLNLDGVVVLDVDCFNRLESRLRRPERVVLVASREEESLSRAWEAGLRSVVYEDDPMQTTLLAVMAAELR